VVNAVLELLLLTAGRWCSPTAANAGGDANPTRAVPLA